MEFDVSCERVCNPILLSDKFSYTDNGKEEGLFIASFIEEPDITKTKSSEPGRRESKIPCSQL